MVFSSIPFLLYFLPGLLLVYFMVPAGLRSLRNLVLVIASLLFYAWGEGATVLLLVVSIVANHLLAKGIARTTLRLPSRFILVVGIAVNLAFLGWYKYAAFIAELLGLTEWSPPTLPLGISFFTFQAISYLIDVYRKEAEPGASLLNSALYIASFPQLIAGPIVRYKTVAQQIVARQESYYLFALGIQTFVVGLAQKVLLANTVGEIADAAFSMPALTLTVLHAWVGLVAYSLQIFFDFAGYSNMAIGLGLMLGFRFPKNFDMPYSAQSVTEFWRRWHMTLSAWFRDYLYIPLGGNRQGNARTVGNLWLVFLLCGLWHGAAWTFILWGAWHGLFLSLERLYLSRHLAKLWQPLRHLYLLLAVFLGWVLFRADSLEHALIYYRALFALGDHQWIGAPIVQSNNLLVVLMLAFLLATNIPRKGFELMLDNVFIGHRSLFSTTYVRGIFYCMLMALMVLCISVLMGAAYNPFIYFRF